MQRATSNFRAVVNCRSLVPFQTSFFLWSPLPSHPFRPFLSLSLPPRLPLSLSFSIYLLLQSVPLPPLPFLFSFSLSLSLPPRPPRIAGKHPANGVTTTNADAAGRSRANFRAWFACHAVNLATGPQKRSHRDRQIESSSAFARREDSSRIERRVSRLRLGTFVLHFTPRSCFLVGENGRVIYSQIDRDVGFLRLIR